MSTASIIILVDSYNTNGGASKSIRDCIKTLKQRGRDVQIYCSRCSYQELPDNVRVVRSVSALHKALLSNDSDVAIFFKAAKSLVDRSIFSKFLAARKELTKKIHVITVVCQQPSNPKTILTPFVIEHSDHLVFIDKTAYHDPLYSFIPEERKSWTYLSIPDDGPNPLDKYVKTDYSLKNGTVVFGRGSSFNKCPKNVLEPFDKMNLAFRKKFVIIGVPKQANWLSKQIGERDDVETYPLVEFDEWMSYVSSFDIGLYCLPQNAHSSIDGTLGQMMRVGLPVIVGGAPAPKERIIHGENGFIADTVEDVIHYSELLANNPELRERIGQRARQTTIELNSKSWVDHLEQTIATVRSIEKVPAIAIPVTSVIRIAAIHYFSTIKAWMVRPLKKFFYN